MFSLCFLTGCGKSLVKHSGVLRLTSAVTASVAHFHAIQMSTFRQDHAINLFLSPRMACKIHTTLTSSDLTVRQLKRDSPAFLLLFSSLDSLLNRSPPPPHIFVNRGLICRPHTVSPGSKNKSITYVRDTIYMPVCIKSQICGGIIHICIAAVFPTLVCMFNARMHAA